jgi:Rrf2 family protein
MISQTAEYALRAVVCLADHAGRSLTVRQVAEITRVPAGYLAKILNLLTRAGLVSAHRGINGGYALLQPPAEITLLDIVLIADPSHRVKECPLGIPSHANGNLCPLHQRTDAAAAAAEAALAASTVADVLADRSGGEPLCRHEPIIPTNNDNPTPHTNRCSSCTK